MAADSRPVTPVSAGRIMPQRCPQFIVKRSRITLNTSHCDKGRRTMLKHTRIIQRLGALLLFNIALMVALGSIGYLGMSSIREGLRTVYEDRTVALGQVKVIVTNYYEVRLAVLASLQAKDQAAVAEKQTAVNARKADAAQTWT